MRFSTLPFRFVRPKLAGIAAALMLTLGAVPCAAQITIIPNYTGFNATAIATVNAAIAQYTSQFTTFPGVGPQTIVINFQNMGSGLGQSDTPYVSETYASYYATLLAQRTSPDDFTAVASLPNQANNPVNNNPNISMPRAMARVLGYSVTAGSQADPDSIIGINLSICNLDRVPANQNPSKYDLQGVAQHELDEGFFFGSSGIGGPDVTPQDLFRWHSNGVRTPFTTSGSPGDYFSINSGATNLATYNNGNNGGDWGDFDLAALRVQNYAGTPGAQPNMGVELRMGDIEGFTPVPEPATMALAGAAIAGGYWRFRRRHAARQPRLDAASRLYSKR